MSRLQKWGISLFLVCFLWFWCIGIQGALAADPVPASNKKNPSQNTSTQAAGSSENPSIQIPQSAFDFGEVLDGGEVVHEYLIKNTGGAELRIDQVRPG